MDVIETRVNSFVKFLINGVTALAVLMLSGFLTEASAQGTSTIVVRARGTAGGESISLRVDNATVATWSLSTSYQTFSASTNSQRRRHGGVHE